MQVQNLSSEARSQISRLLDISTETRDAIVNDRLLKALAFDGMTHKFDMVAKAYSDTYRWILDDENSNPHGINFRSWLSSGSGIFHIAGKPGAGKSTLMKRLCQDERTVERLKIWAQPKRLIFGNFFFLKPTKAESGASSRTLDLRSSLYGLLRSLLYQVLKACPELSQRVLPGYWTRLLLLDWRASPVISIANEEVERAFDILLQSQDLYHSHKICFFVDGLDEFDDAENDLEDLVMRLKSWPDASMNGIKLCVSSREVNAVRFRLPQETKFRVQEITQGDIEHFVKERLAGNRPESMPTYTDGDIKSLVSQIASKSQGVFLWVRLVTDSVRQGMLNGNTQKTLEQRINHFSSELNELFQDLLSSIHPVEKEMALKTFALIRFAQWSEAFVPLFWYHGFDTYQADQDFAYRLSFSDDGITASEEQAIEDETIRTVNGRCMGLVEVRSAVEDYNLVRGQLGLNRYITFSHRSVLEFLDRVSSADDFWDSLDLTTSGHMVGVLLLAFLKSTRLNDFKWARHMKETHPTMFVLRHVFVCMAKDFEQPQTDYWLYESAKLLDALNDAIIRRLPGSYKDLFFELARRKFLFGNRLYQIGWSIVRYSEHISIYHVAARFGIHSFVLHWTDENPILDPGDSYAADLLLFATQGMLELGNHATDTTLKKLLDCGISPNTVLSWADTPIDRAYSEEIRTEEMSVWDKTLIVWLRGSCGADEDSLVLEYYLAHGAHQHIKLVRGKIPAPEVAQEYWEWLSMDCMSLVDNGRNVLIKDQEMTARWKRALNTDCLPTELVADVVTLKDLVQYLWKPLNMEAILSLMDKAELRIRTEATLPHHSRIEPGAPVKLAK